MLALIIRKEIVDNLLNARFIAACVVSLGLVLATVMVLTRQYEVQVNDFHSRTVTQDRFIDSYGHTNRLGWMDRQMHVPPSFRTLILGIDREASEKNLLSNPVPALLPRFDFITIVTVILSIVALLFSYDTISGERESGLLRLIISTGGARSSLVLGKFIGGNISLLIPFTIGGLAGFLYLALSQRVLISTTDVGVFLLLLAASWLLLSTFYGLGLLMSSLSASSSQAILTSLFAWTMFVLVIPNISPFLAAQIYQSPSIAKVEKDTWRIEDQERDQIVRRRWDELLRGPFADLAGITSMTPNAIAAKSASDPGFRQRYAEYTKAWDAMVSAVNIEQRRKANQVRKGAEQRSQEQESLAKVFAALSPVSTYVFLATDITETGLYGETRWDQQESAYEAELYSFMGARYEREHSRNPALGPNDYLDLRDRPRFSYQPGTVAERLAVALPRFGLLALFDLMFLAVAYVCFLRYDVR